jgi:hypothetical protein
MKDEGKRQKVSRILSPFELPLATAGGTDPSSKFSHDKKG